MYSGWTFWGATDGTEAADWKPLSDTKCQFLSGARMGKKKKKWVKKRSVMSNRGREAFLMCLAFLAFIWIQKHVLESNLW